MMGIYGNGNSNMEKGENPVNSGGAIILETGLVYLLVWRSYKWLTIILGD
jgi:hypothetical protein